MLTSAKKKKKKKTKTKTKNTNDIKMINNWAHKGSKEVKKHTAAWVGGCSEDFIVGESGGVSDVGSERVGVDRGTRPEGEYISSHSHIQFKSNSLCE